MKDRLLFELEIGRPFHLGLTVMSHGFVDLLPFCWDREERSLNAVIRTAGAKAFALKIRSVNDNRPGQRLEVIKTAGPRASRADIALLRERIRWSLRLDEDLSEFQMRCGRTKGLTWVKKYGLGRFLRNSDPFEEFTKVLITTNINWQGTKLLNRNLLDYLGDPVGPQARDGTGRRAFPRAETVAARSERFLRDKIRLGYRAPFLKELAKTFATGRIDVESFKDPARPIQDLAADFASLQGFGPYSVNTLLMGYSRYENLILDSWIRRVVAERHFKGRRVPDTKIRKVYAPWGRWAALACWFECAHDSWIKDELRGRGRGIVVDS